MNKEKTCGGSNKNWLDSINKSRGNRSKSLSPYDNPDRTASWLFKQILGNLKAANDKTEIESEDLIEIAQKAVDEAEIQVKEK